MKKLVVRGLAALGTVAAFGAKWVDAHAPVGGNGTDGAAYLTSFAGAKGMAIIMR